MNNKGSNRFCFIFVVLLLVYLTAAIPVRAQERRETQNAQGMQPQGDPLAYLKQALSKAGASALDSSQQTALNALIAKFQNTNGPAKSDPSEQAAMDAYNNAILAKDLESATKAEGTLSKFILARLQKMMEAQPSLEIQILSYLHRDQVAALQTTMGNKGIISILRPISFSVLTRLGLAVFDPRLEMRPGNVR